MLNNDQDKKAKEIIDGLKKGLSGLERAANIYRECIEAKNYEGISQIKKEFASFGEPFFVAMERYTKGEISKEVFYNEAMSAILQYQNQKGIQDLFNKRLNSDEDESGQ